MSNKNCNRKNLLIKEFKHDWDELNISFKSLIMVGIVLFLVVVLIAFFSDGGNGVKNSLEVVFRSTLASVFGFLLSSNIKFNKKEKKIKIEEIKGELNKLEQELDNLDEDLGKENEQCELEPYYSYKDINLVQIAIALGISIICISVLSILMLTNNLENMQTISQIRDLMCSSIGFLIGESGKK
ncbi:MAG TPA: hypothetical protein DDY58_10185 [Terrisporobacter glycolicus]|uniref:hypothetical protein n=1 Tax=Terrisporobacter TaxID=1505652 RepID=UPI000E9AA698|nr:MULTISPECIES: hypothetical protein [Terrisporobacter]HBI92759.1 hypothetical protein [Terrisporobacter hibernicus]